MIFFIKYVKIRSMKIKELLEYGRYNLINKDEPNRLSKMLLKSLLKVDDIFLLINSEEYVAEDIQKQFKYNIELLNLGKPIQYIMHNQEFMKMNFYVDENVLIPQPDTEILVEEVINICSGLSCAYTKDQNIRILDLCTGSGAIGISLAKYIENSKVTMSDLSKKALEIANKNAIKNEVKDRCSFINSDMFENINEKYDIIVSNPPYIKTEVINTLSKEVQNEPSLALDGGEDGLRFYRIIANNAWKYLNKNGILALEIGYDQNDDVIKLLMATGKYRDIYSKKDLSNNDRIIVGKHI